MHRILFLNDPHPCLRQALEQAGCVCEEDFFSDEETLVTKLEGYTGLVLRSRVSIRKALLDRAGSLRFIAREGVGLEHIDVEYAESKGIQVITSPEGSRDTVGEHALGLLLCGLNHLARADRQVRQGQWIREKNRGLEVVGKTVGILGYGNMGSAFAQKISGLGARVIAYDKFKTGYGDVFAEEADLETLFRESDILSIHIPYSAENHYFIDEKFLARFHKPIFLINTARGLVVKTDALVAALRSARVFGAALDVVEYEEQSFDRVKPGDWPEAYQYLLASDAVVLSPHIAGWSFESKRKHGEVLAEKILSLLRT